MRMSVLRLAAIGAMIGATAAQAPSQGELIAQAATFGAVSAQASLCGLRDASWVEDLQLSALQAHADHGQLVAALGYGDMEASEDLATDTPAVACQRLKDNPALKRADDAVKAYREAKAGKPAS